MNTPGAHVIREHHFYVSASKHIFIHPNHGLVFAHDPLPRSDWGQYDLAPIILYGITVAGTPIRWLKFSSAAEPCSLRSFLLEAWRDAPGLRGMPDRLKVGRNVAESCPTLGPTLEKIGVQLVVATGQDKVFPTSLRRAQEAAMWLSVDWQGIQRTDSLNNLDLAARKEHRKESDFRDHGRKDVSQRVAAWLALPTRKIDMFLPDDLDWCPGEWLFSWEAVLPPSGPRHFHSDSFDGKIWLRKGRPFEDQQDDDEEIFDDEIIDDAHDVAKDLVSCWPNTATEIAQASGITALKLRWFLENNTPLNNKNRNNLLDILGISLDERFGCYQAEGPCVLIARTMKSIENAYTHLSHGGDLAFSFEVVPIKVAADPSWRYVLFQSIGGPLNVVMIPRGSAVAEKLSGKLLINFEGIQEIPSEFYREIVHSCARACRAPSANLPEMRAFEQRAAVHLQKLERNR